MNAYTLRQRNTYCD